MTEAVAFMSSIAPLLNRYLLLKRALGRQAFDTAYILRYLDQFLMSCHDADLTRETFAAWNESMASLQANTRRARLRSVYHFCLFRRREDPHAFVPDPTQFPFLTPRRLPYIFSAAEVIRLLDAADGLAPHEGSPLQRDVARISVVVLYTTGLRRGELVRLTLGDYEAADQVLHVRQTKFNKSRLVPLSAETAMELDRYLRARRGLGAPGATTSPLLIHNHGAPFRGYSGGGFAQLLRKVIRTAGILTPQGRPPRIHDLRFTFAVHALWRWYRTGVDVQARLPALATYLGHASVVSTEYYLTFFQATAEVASERFRSHSATWFAAGTGGCP
jgi:integrase/recombinase XerD